MKVFEDKLCMCRICDKALTGKQKKYCSSECGTNEARLRAKELENNKLMKKINRPKEKYNDHDCQYCKDSNHTGFCGMRYYTLRL